MNQKFSTTAPSTVTIQNFLLDRQPFDYKYELHFRQCDIFLSQEHRSGSGGGGWALDPPPPLLGHDIGFLTLVPKLDPPFAWRPDSWTLPLPKILHPPLHHHYLLLLAMLYTSIYLFNFQATHTLVLIVRVLPPCYM